MKRAIFLLMVFLSIVSFLLFGCGKQSNQSHSSDRTKKPVEQSANEPAKKADQSATPQVETTPGGTVKIIIDRKTAEELNKKIGFDKLLAARDVPHSVRAAGLGFAFWKWCESIAVELPKERKFFEEVMVTQASWLSTVLSPPPSKVTEKPELVLKKYYAQCRSSLEKISDNASINGLELGFGAGFLHWTLFNLASRCWDGETINGGQRLFVKDRCNDLLKTANYCQLSNVRIQKMETIKNQLAERNNGDGFAESGHELEAWFVSATKELK